MAKRLMCIALIAIMLCGILASCKAPTVEDGPADTVEETVIETDKWGQAIINTGIPEDLDYQGAEVSFLMRQSERFNYEFGNEEFVLDASLLESKIFERNQTVERELGVDLKFHKTITSGNDEQFYNSVLETRKSNDGAYDVIVAYAAFGVAPTIRGCYLDLNSDAMTYLASDKAYWNQSYIEQASLNDKLYYITGDVNLSTFDRSIVVYFNESKCSERGITGLYDLALSGGWTYGAFYTYVTNLEYEELDGQKGKTDGDSYILAAMRPSESYDGFLAAFDLKLLTKQDNGRYSVNVEGNTTMSNAAIAIKDLYSSNGSYLAKSTATVNDLFASGRTLFAVDIMYRSADQNAKYVNMKDSYGILPLPKYTTDQPNYYTTPQDAYNIMSVIVGDNVDPEMVSATLETLSSESYKNIRPYYFENIVKSRYFSGLKSAQVFDLVLDSVVFDTGVIYMMQLNGLIGPWRSACDGSDLGQKYAEIAEGVEQSKRDFEDWIFNS